MKITESYSLTEACGSGVGQFQGRFDAPEEPPSPISIALRESENVDVSNADYDY